MFFHEVPSVICSDEPLFTLLYALPRRETIPDKSKKALTGFAVQGCYSWFLGRRSSRSSSRAPSIIDIASSVCFSFRCIQLSMKKTGTHGKNPMNYIKREGSFPPRAEIEGYGNFDGKRVDCYGNISQEAAEIYQEIRHHPAIPAAHGLRVLPPQPVQGACSISRWRRIRWHSVATAEAM